jgi:hypothetical protein
VRPLPVQLDDQPVFLVAAVPEAPAAVGLGERDLLAGCGQPVRALHIPAIPKLKQRVRSPSRRGYELVELISPAQLLAGAQRLPQRPLPGKPPPERGRYPSAGVIQAIRRTREIDDRLLDEGMRRDSARKPRFRIDMRGQVDFYSGRFLDPAAGRDRHVDKPRAALSETIQFRRCLVAQLRPFARVKHSRPQLRLAPHWPAEGGVHP